MKISLKNSKSLLTSFFVGTLLAVSAMIVLAANPAPDHRPVRFSASVSPAVADTSVTITTSGTLSAGFDRCQIEGNVFLSYLSDYAESMQDDAVLVSGGVFSGVFIPVNVTPGELGSCNAGGNTSGGQPSQFSGVKTFNTSGLPNGDYVLTLNATDNTNSSAVTNVQFTVLHPSAPPPGSQVSCSPSNQTVAINQNVTLTASAGDGNFSWSAPGAVTATGSGSSFTTKYTTAGTKTVTVSSAGINKNCVVTVSAGTPACAGVTVKVNSNAPTTWSITNPTGHTLYSPGHPNPATTATYTKDTDGVTNLPQGSYTIFPSTNAAGRPLLGVTPGQAQHADCGNTLTYTLNYGTVPPTSTPATLVVTPASQSINVNDHAFYTATYDPDGTGPQAPQDVSLLASWNSSNANVGAFSGAGSGRADFRGVAVGTATILASYGGLTANAALIVGNGGSPAPTLVVSPPTNTIQVGSAAYYVATYDPDGTGPQPATNVTSAATWNSNRPSVAAYAGSGSSAASFQGVSPGSATIRATYSGISGTASLQVTNNPPPVLTALLVPDPDQGDAPLATTLIAAAGGSAVGTLNYTFWRNCNYIGTNVATAISQCGTPDAKFDGINDNPKSTNVIYPGIGNYVAKVIVEQGGYSAEAGASVTVRGEIEVFHRECVANSCAIVNGAGPNRCDVDEDCGSDDEPPIDPVFGGVCDVLIQACVNRAGAVSNCSSDPACGGSGPSHLECQNQACVIVGGAGSDTCSAIGSECELGNPGPGPGPGPAGSCTFTAAPKLIPKGGSSKLTWSCGSGISNCTVTDTGTGAIVGSNGRAGNVNVSPVSTTIYSLNCDSGAFTTSTTVRVLSITEVPPKR